MKIAFRTALVVAAVVGFAAAGASAVPARAAASHAAAGQAVVTSFTIPGWLYGVAAVSARDAWAVGASDSSSNKPEYTLIVHWDGTRWSQVTSPKPVHGDLKGITALSADNVWAVGWTYNSKGLQKALVMHWNGKAWSRQSGVPSVIAALNAVAASGNNVWAVGQSDALNEPAVVLHRIGSRWYVVPVETPVNSAFFGVAMTPGGTAWASGEVTISGGGYRGLLMRWNGSAWKSVSNPLRGANNFLQGIAVTNAGAIWVVGANSNNTSTAYTAVSMLWNGKTWQKVPVGLTPQHSNLAGVTLDPDGAVWAVGFDGPDSAIVRWTGHAWTLQANPDDEVHSELYNVAATSMSDAWAVGWTWPSWYETAILHWNGTAWS